MRFPPQKSRNYSKTLVFSNLVKLGITPSTKTLNLFLSFLLKSQKPNLLLHLFSQISSNSIKINSKTCSLVAQSLLELHQFEAEEITSCAERFNFVLKRGIWNSVIQCICVKEENPERAFSILSQCIENYGIFPSSATFRPLVLKFSSQGKMERAIEVLELMRSEKFGYTFDNVICSSVVSGFSRIGKPELGLKFYEEAEKANGFKPNLVTCTAIVDALRKKGRIDEARESVRRMEDKGVVLDAVLYSSLICGYFKKGISTEGLRTHRLMVEKGIAPDVVSYTNLIDGLCKEGSVEKVIGFLDAMEKNGMKPNLITYTILLQGFCMRGKLEEAFCVLKRMEEFGLVLDEFVFAIFIDGLCRKGDVDRVFSLLEEMERKGIKVGSVTYNTVINGLCKSGKTSKADEISRGYFGDNFTYSTLLQGYTKEKDVDGVMETKRRLEEAGICKDVVTFNVLIKALFMVGMIEDARVLFKEMPNMGVIANSVTYCTMIDGLCKKGEMEEALEVFQEYRRIFPLLDAASPVCIIRGLCKEHMMEMATEVFKEFAAKHLVSDSITYRNLIKAQFRAGNGEGVLKFIHAIDEVEPELLTSICNDALIFLCRKGSFTAALAACIFMRRKRLSVTSKSYYVLLKCLIRSGNKLITELVMCDCIKVNGPFEPRMINILSLYLCKKNVEEAVSFLADKNKKDVNVSVLTATVDALKKEGRSMDALNFLMDAQRNGAVIDVVVCSTVVDGLCKEGRIEKALDLCANMNSMGIHPNIVVCNSLINGLCQQGCLIEAFRFFDSLETNGLFPTNITYGTLIGVLSREGFMEDAEELFKKMILKGITPNTQIYNSLISGYSSFGLIEKSLKLLQELEESGLQADAFTISSVIRGYCQKGETQGAYGFFNEYKRRGFSPDLLGFLILVEGLFVKTRMKEARDVLRDMLQCEEVVDVIDRTGNEHQVDSLVSLLNLFCEQGRIQEAICVISEVGSEAFPSWRSRDTNRLKQIKQLQKIGSLDITTEEKVPNNGLCEISDKKDTNVGNYELLFEKSLPYDYDASFSIIASLCSRGELQKANNAVKTMLLASDGHC
ncbi:uncharacterized protein A4U43_C07F7840 [Asparagus officinalis]|uniref:Pentacotripeptide-repeat region of PRORP domain-containing protein n=1 Tax=Asparagus officinalis TaxID=4686 RepID=A0A5P1ED89_ASPOF|nr:pentatricopeptide repeat-containing protein At5g57250, mitochondrial [Asparagus officinalis]XP_020273560.1 pentatricopeptide repeat-containing protein At5g57250, mitochondrial [Asparagus officinalis]XP_020273561.1 pentatricopeptide repeat-containing protein At5g57250, mitochondrial [Asparagus officinalis]ONK62759.1 uncharacterized protein A4U43_C07F7840 [Asparagus officinalis]